ncbi:MAG: hypothetical protein AAGB26_15750 [Planctomycetota bacterium]
MSSWVRYSVAVYIGLLISGALANQPWHPAGDALPPEPSVHFDMPSLERPLTPAQDQREQAKTDVSV